MIVSEQGIALKPDKTSFFIIDGLGYLIIVTALGAILGMGPDYILNISLIQFIHFIRLIHITNIYNM